MTSQQIRFDDGAAYEQMMGKWSPLAGDVFLDWLAPPAGQRWVDIGCGNGAFTERLIERCAPTEVQAIDPSEGQLSFARTRPGVKSAVFQIGDAMALPFPNDRFDAAVMALVIFFVPEPAVGVAEMARVVCPGGTVAAYAWDILGGGFPLEPLNAELRAMGLNPPRPPNIEASRVEVLRDLWTGAGLIELATREITVQRTFADFDDFWRVSQLGSSVRPMIAGMSQGDADLLKSRLRARLPAETDGRIRYSARANAIKGRRPA